MTEPGGSNTKLTTIKRGKGDDKREPMIKDIVPLAKLDDIVFGGWDIFSENVYEAAKHAEVLKDKDIDMVKDELIAIKPMKGAFAHEYVTRLNGTWIKETPTKWDMVEQLREDIRDFKAKNNCDRLVVIWAASTEIYVPMTETHLTL